MNIMRLTLWIKRMTKRRAIATVITATAMMTGTNQRKMERCGPSLKPGKNRKTQL